MTTKLVWRLSKLPSVEELQSLVKDKIITQDEARDILFKSENEEDRDKESLKTEIKFLRELIDKLSANNFTKIIETIKYIDRPYRNYPWYNPYVVYCSTAGSVTANAVNAGTTLTAGTGTSGNSFTAINTF